MPSNIFSPNFVAFLALFFMFVWMIGQMLLGMFIALLTKAINKKPYSKQTTLHFSYAAFGLFLPMLITFPFMGMTQHNNSTDMFLAILAGVSVFTSFVGGILWSIIKSYDAKTLYD